MFFNQDLCYKTYAEDPDNIPDEDLTDIWTMNI